MKILCIDTNHSYIVNQLESYGFEIEEDYHSDYNTIGEKIHHYEGLILRSRIPIDKNILQKATQLQWIARVGAGLENIDVAYAESRKIKILSAAEGNKSAVAEHAMGMLLMMLHKLRTADREVRQNIWKREENRGDELKTKTVGILGYGVMGNAFAKRLTGFGVETICYDILPNKGNQYAKQVSLQVFFEKTDILSIHLPLTANTIGMVNEDFLSQFKKDLYLINTARGKNIVTKDLITLLESGKIKYAALDVLEFEKSSFETLDSNESLQYLQQSDKVILTPHIAGWSLQSNLKMAYIIVEKIIQLYPKLSL